YFKHVCSSSGARLGKTIADYSAHLLSNVHEISIFVGPLAFQVFQPVCARHLVLRRIEPDDGHDTMDLPFGDDSLGESLAGCQGHRTYRHESNSLTLG